MNSLKIQETEEAKKGEKENTQEKTKFQEGKKNFALEQDDVEDNYEEEYEDFEDKIDDDANEEVGGSMVLAQSSSVQGKSQQKPGIEKDKQQFKFGSFKAEKEEARKDKSDVED